MEIDLLDWINTLFMISSTVLNSLESIIKTDNFCFSENRTEKIIYSKK